MILRPLRLQAGLSLIELMIAMALSLLLMLGVLQIFLSSKQTYTTNNSLSRLQESGRFAMSFITYDLRNAGYKGECLTTVNNSLITNGTDDRYNLEQGIKGWDAQTSLPSWPSNFATEKRVGTDSILINHAAKSAGALSADVLSTATGISLATGSPQNTNGAYLIVASALSCDIFKSGTNTANNISIDKPAGRNLSQNYGSAISKILAFQSHQYFIKNGASGVPSLWRVQRDGNTEPSEELVEGVLDLQFEYGIGAGVGEDLTVSSYAKANAVSNWGNVVSVKIRLLAVGDRNTSPETQVYDREKGLICKKNDSTAACLAANSVDIPDNRLAQVFSATVGLRNRLP